MFKNFGKVFKFTFKNSAGGKSYIIFTVLVAILLLVAPGFLYAIKNQREEKKEIASCGAGIIYVADEYAKDADFNFLNYVGEKNYEKIIYKTFADEEDALKAANESGRSDVLVLYIKQDQEKNFISNIIIPSSSDIDSDKAENLLDFLDKAGEMFTLNAVGVNMKNLADINVSYETEVYSSSGYKNGTILSDEKADIAAKNSEKVEDNGLTVSENDAIDAYLPTFKVVLTYLNLMILYFLILTFSASFSQNVVLEKDNKLMDTMLVSLKPEALILGKFLGVSCAGLLQIFVWLGALCLGAFGGIGIVGRFMNLEGNPVVTFVKALFDMGIFKPLNVVIAVIAIIAGFEIYMALAAVAGSLSSNREEAQSNASIYTLVLVASFFAVFIGGGLNQGDSSIWMYFVPTISALILPAGIATATVTTVQAAIGMGLMVVLSVVFIIAAGRLYKMMSLYKGNKVSIGKALKMLLTNK